jgi:hypothetical protein
VHTWPYLSTSLCDFPKFQKIAPKIDLPTEG